MIAFYFEALKKLAAILFLSAYLFSARGNSEFFKINKLVQHSNETKGNDATVTVLHFLVTHYSNDKYNDGTKQLVFKSPVTDISNSLRAFNFFSHIQLFIPSFFEINKTVFLIINEDFVAAKRGKVVWHPPNTVTARSCFVLFMIK